jgi:hypothetical protein
MQALVCEQLQLEVWILVWRYTKNGYTGVDWNTFKVTEHTCLINMGICSGGNCHCSELSINPSNHLGERTFSSTHLNIGTTGMWSAPTFCRFNRRKYPQLYPKAGLDVPEKRKISCKCWKSNPDSSVTKLQDRHYTDWAILAPENYGSMNIPQLIRMMYKLNKSEFKYASKCSQ